MTQGAERIKDHCPECGPDRWSDVMGYHSHRSEDQGGMVWLHTDYRILQCRGCDAVYFQTDSVFSEDVDAGHDEHTGEYMDYTKHTITYWPVPTRRDQPTWSMELITCDRDLSSLVDDVYKALNNDLRVLAAIGIRTAFDRASELLGVDPAEGFPEKLKKLVALGKIGEDERETLSVLTDAGGAAAHRGWNPAPTQLDTMMNIVEAFLHRSFVLDEAAKRLKQGVPNRPKLQRRKMPDAPPAG